MLASFPDAHFVIVGGELEGLHHQRGTPRGSDSLPDELGVASAVTFTGYRSDVPQIMAAADVVAHCSTHPDPFPGVVLQGMTLGKAVVASDIGGPREQIEDGLSGSARGPRRLGGARAGDLRSSWATRSNAASLGSIAASSVRDRFTSDGFYRRLAEYLRRPHRGEVVVSAIERSHRRAPPTEHRWSVRPDMRSGARS